VELILGCFGGAREGIKLTKGVERERRIMATERDKEWVGTTLDAGKVDSGDTVEITAEFEEGRGVCFVPEAGEEFFSRDDVRRVVGSWDVAHRLGGPRVGMTKPGRHAGTGPYDTCAV
jgi:hypothetical protein